jgi:hypothetical protein
MASPGNLPPPIGAATIEFPYIHNVNIRQNPKTQSKAPFAIAFCKLSANK